MDRLQQRSMLRGIRVDHYAVKSREEFLNKRWRGLVQPEPRDWDTYFAGQDRNEIEEPVPVWLVERTKVEMARLVASIAA
jgi:hypothetical protein